MNILVDKLPTDYEGLKINTNFRSFILFELLMQDREIEKEDKIALALDLFYDELNVFLELPMRLRKIYCALLFDIKEFEGFFCYLGYNIIKNGVLFVFNLGEVMDSSRAKNLNPVVLAFIGDAVYSLFIREKLAFQSDKKVGELNKLATQSVKATAQAEFLKCIMPLLNDDEIAIYKRARNAKKTTRAKSASVAEYNCSTGFEALVGYLYVIGDLNRLNFLLNKGEVNEG